MAVYYLVFRIFPAAAAGVYSYFYVRRILSFCKQDLKKVGTKALNVGAAFVFALLAGNFWSARAMLVLHLLAVSMALDLAVMAARFLFRKRNRENRFFRAAGFLYRCGLLPVIVTAAMLGYGYYNMGHAVRTEYRMETEKNLEQSCKVILITDIHYGTIQNTEVLKGKIAQINAEEPDLVILGGDLVDEGTSKERMEEVFRVLGGIKSRYGIYYVYGNHDRQPYTDQPTFADSELAEAIRQNGIVILEDEAVEIGSDVLLAGRADAAWGNIAGRASAEELLKDTDRDRFIIMADHQPVEAAENAAAGVDLLVSGHTHAGQIWPIGVFSELFGVLNYGEYQEGNCRVIVSSGFTGWGYPFRTEKHCEYVVVNVETGKNVSLIQDSE